VFGSNGYFSKNSIFFESLKARRTGKTPKKELFEKKIEKYSLIRQAEVASQFFYFYF